VANSSVSNCILFIRLLTHITSQCTDTNGKGWATDGEGEQILAIFTGFSLEDLLGCALTQGNLEAERYWLHCIDVVFCISRMCHLYLCAWLQLGRFGCIPDCTYQFVDRNGWPVAADQENDLQVIDALQNMCVKIAWTTDVESCSPAVVKKTSVTTVKLKRSFSMEPSTTKRPRLVFHSKFGFNCWNLTTIFRFTWISQYYLQFWNYETF